MVEPSLNSSTIDENVMLVEDFDADADSKFLNEVALPYFGTIFKDISMRRMSPLKKNDKKEMIDKAAFYEYTQLPGMINDRFYMQLGRPHSALRAESSLNTY